MKITVKLFASLAAHLPVEARERHQVDLDVPLGSSVLDVIQRQRVPESLCAIVLVDGHWVARGDRGSRILGDGEVVAIWPPVAGGASAFVRILEMAISREEFLRLLPGVIGAFEADGDTLRWREGNRTGTIRLVALPARKIGACELPRHRVVLALDDCAEDEGKAFMTRFHRAFLRGGG